ncbi:MAG: M24 family metallopeptidase [Bdellovibrionales bacterium]|jgi:Xaa-Pro aminopeptidase|nr:M24 family metallopeptidase [Bdellovibrionales bacterium]
MTTPSITKTGESVGEHFSDILLQVARDKTLETIQTAARKIKAGMRESEARSLVQEIQAELGAPKSWHPSQIRFGPNSTLPFGKKGEADPILNENDIFFLDIGPIFDGHEGDVGRAFAIGDDEEMHRCCRDVEVIWQEVRNHWKSSGVSGQDLYEFAKRSSESRGWVLLLEKANGHRISDFPHAARMRGSIEGLEHRPAENRWILEIQIRHPSREFGAFYEDLLN